MERWTSIQEIGEGKKWRDEKTQNEVTRRDEKIENVVTLLGGERLDFDCYFFLAFFMF